MDTKPQVYKSKGFVFLLIGFAVYLGLLQFSEYWLGVLTHHDIGVDFHIYYDAYLKALSGDNPYLPYYIGSSFVNHPFVLSFLSLFSWHQEKWLATFLWVATSALTWVIVVRLVYYLVRTATAKREIPDDHRHLGWILAAFLGFAPFWETVHVGQINVFAILALCLVLYYSERNKPVLAGIALGFAIVLKTSPIIFVLYYLVLRKFGLLISCAVTLALLSAVPLFQFSPSALTDFMAILPELGKEIQTSPYNQSILSLSVRLCDALGFENMDPVLTIGHKIALIGVLGLILLPALARPSTKLSRLWEFSLLTVTMTLFSPLVWYHHSIFLILPLTLLLLHSNRRYALLGIGLLFVIQFERLFEYKIANFAVPIALVEFVLLGFGLWIHFTDGRGRAAPLE